MSLENWMGKKKPKETMAEKTGNEKPPIEQPVQIEPPTIVDEAEKREILKSKIHEILGDFNSPSGLDDESIPDEIPVADEPASETLEQEFLGEIERFKAWISSRSYLKGDLDTAGTMVTSLATIYGKIRNPTNENESDLQAKLKKISTAELYKKVPPDFLPAGVRKALFHIIKGKFEKNDHYHIKKLQQEAESAAKTHQIYQIILELLDRAKFKAKMSKKKVNAD